MDKTVGVLAIQGDITEHINSINAHQGYSAAPVKYPDEIMGVDALVLPGGESTTISKLLEWHGITDTIKKFGESGKPILGTCAGMVLLSKSGGEKTQKTGQKMLGLIEAKVSRNAFGPQRESFEELIDIPSVGEKKYRGVFIRAPAYESVGAGVDVLASLGDKIISARQDNIFACSFHPELSDDRRFTNFFLSTL